MLGVSAVIAFVVTVGAFLPALSELAGAAGRDPANLPDAITVCGREWSKDPLDRSLTRDEVFERTEAEPIVVSIGILPACPPEIGAQDGGATGTPTVVYVRTGEDAFVPYSLVGRP